MELRAAIANVTFNAMVFELMRVEEDRSIQHRNTVMVVV
jgi:hypothetical protein